MTRSAPAGVPVQQPPPGRPWTVLQLVLWSADYLKGKGVESGRLDAEHLLAHVLDLDRLSLYLQFERPLTAEELSAFKALLLRRVRREPLQHILGTAPFREIELAVDRRALIPRPETEELVGRVLDRVKGSPMGGQGPSALDLGTGTGAIALSLAVEGAFTEVVAVDRSGEALTLARENLARLADRIPTGCRVILAEGDLFDPVPKRRFDVIVSNPPYVGEDERSTLQPEVLDWDPSEALFAGSDGLAVIRRILQGAGAHLVPGGLLAMEIGAGQGGAVMELALATGEFADLRIERDLAGRERFFLAHTLNEERKEG